MYKSKTKPDCFFFNNKEEEAMKVLWAANRPLSATEIAEGIPNRQWPISSIQNILRYLKRNSLSKLSKLSN